VGSADDKAGEEEPFTGTVLVIDDERHSLDILTRFLALGDFATMTAASGEDGLALARSQPIDVIVLDVSMPGMDGLAVCEELRQDERTRGIPVILLTGHDDTRTRAAGMRLGVMEYLTKPVSRPELLTRVRAQLHARHLARRIDETLAKL
jgi:DNA-binding response OmpR family regulator